MDSIVFFLFKNKAVKNFTLRRRQKILDSLYVSIHHNKKKGLDGFILQVLLVTTHIF